VHSTLAHTHWHTGPHTHAHRHAHTRPRAQTRTDAQTRTHTTHHQKHQTISARLFSSHAIPPSQQTRRRVRWGRASFFLHATTPPAQQRGIPQTLTFARAAHGAESSFPQNQREREKRKPFLFFSVHPAFWRKKKRQNADARQQIISYDTRLGEKPTMMVRFCLYMLRLCVCVCLCASVSV